ncbi:MAG: isopentenyl-diphosphate Delta-isomerase [Chitinophagaceae bacterium]|nr:isopentenyl-diphosphate Delta-isomerase [Chitinophagaceae bacterium]
MADVILVDENDTPAGTMEKMEAHQKGVLHRALSIFIFNSKGEMLLHQRALDKYHSGGLWTNTCCSHPLPGEENKSAAIRRLKEEMGFETAINEVFTFIYKTSVGNGLTEHEFDHVFTGVYDGEIKADKNEVMDFSYRTMAAIETLLQTQPTSFTEWFRIAFPKIKEQVSNKT